MAKIVEGGAARQEQLEERIATVKQLIQTWQKFYDILLTTFDPTESSQAYEPEFQKIKQVIAERHEELVDVVTHDHYVAQNVLNMMRRAVSLETFRGLSELEVRKTIIDWHDANTLLYETLGDLTYDRDQIERQKELSLVTRPKRSGPHPIVKLLTSSRLRVILFWVIVIGAVAALVLNWDAVEKSDIWQDYFASWAQAPIDWIKGLFGGEQKK